MGFKVLRSFWGNLGSGQNLDDTIQVSGMRGLPNKDEDLGVRVENLNMDDDLVWGWDLNDNVARQKRHFPAQFNPYPVRYVHLADVVVQERLAERAICRDPRVQVRPASGSIVWGYLRSRI